MTTTERAEAPPYHLVRAKDICTPPAYSEMILDMTKTCILASNAQRCKILLKTEQKKRDDYGHACCTLCDHILVLLPQIVVNKLKACKEGKSMIQTRMKKGGVLNFVS